MCSMNLAAPVNNCLTVGIAELCELVTLLQETGPLPV